MKMELVPVPCNGCRARCKNELIILHAAQGDRIADYETEPATNPITGMPAVALAHKPNGDCVYLDDKGCSIHDRAPAICRAFDCRKFLAGFGDREAQRAVYKSGMVSRDVYLAARKRMK